MNILDAILENIAEPFYAITFVVTLWRYPKYYNTPLKFFPIIIAYTLLNEVIAGILLKNPDLFILPINNFYSNYNYFIYNIYNIIYFLYFFLLFWKYIDNIIYKKLILIGSIVFTLISFINIFIQNIYNKPQIITYSFGSIFLIILILTYFNQIEWHQNKLNPTKNILFWIGWGLLIFYSGYLPIKLFKYFKASEYEAHINLYVWLKRFHLFLIPVMYTCFIIGFIKMKRNLKK